MRSLIWLTVVVVLYTCSVAGQNATPQSPVIKSAEMPLYPHLARVARVQGTVQLKVTTDGASITNIVATGTQKLLLSAAEANVKTWTFYKHRPQTFTVTFVYKLEAPEVYGFVNPTVLLELPNRVEIRAKMPMPMP
jgi:hypothetical protein